MFDIAEALKNRGQLRKVEINEKKEQPAAAPGLGSIAMLAMQVR